MTGRKPATRPSLTPRLCPHDGTELLYVNVRGSKIWLEARPHPDGVWLLAEDRPFAKLAGHLDVELPHYRGHAAVCHGPDPDSVGIPRRSIPRIPVDSAEAAELREIDLEDSRGGEPVAVPSSSGDSDLVAATGSTYSERAS